MGAHKRPLAGRFLALVASKARDGDFRCWPMLGCWNLGVAVISAKHAGVGLRVSVRPIFSASLSSCALMSGHYLSAKSCGLSRQEFPNPC